MSPSETDRDAEVAFRALLSLPVLALAIAVANVTSLPIDLAPYAERMELLGVRRAFNAGYGLQLASGIWLSLSLLLDVRRFARVALLAWLTALSLVLAPVPTLLQDPAAALVPLAAVVFGSLLAWALGPSLRGARSEPC